MYIDAVNSDASDWERVETMGSLNGFQVTLSDSEKNSEIAPLMQRISAEYERTRPDGSSDRIKIEVDLKKDESKDQEGPSNSQERDNNAGDIDSRDRDQG